MGKGKGIIAIPEGRNGSGWDGFVRKARELVSSSSSVFVSENRGVFNNGIAKEVSMVKSLIGVSSSHEAPYLSTLMEPTKDNPGPSNKHGKDNIRKDLAVLILRNKKDGSKEVNRRNFSDDEVAGWHPTMLKKVEEVERSLWHIRAKLLGWKHRLDSMLKTIDEGLGLIMGLGHVSKRKIETIARVKGGCLGLRSLSQMKELGLLEAHTRGLKQGTNIIVVGLRVILAHKENCFSPSLRRLCGLVCLQGMGLRQWANLLGVFQRRVLLQ